jgi:hypothetical protein
MIDQNYFEKVLVGQLLGMERPARLIVFLATGAELEIRSVVAKHETYVVFEVYSKNKEPEHSKRWQDANPALDPTVYDQIAVPYGHITHTHLTARSKRGHDRRVIGFGDD